MPLHSEVQLAGRLAHESSISPGMTEEPTMQYGRSWTLVASSTVLGTSELCQESIVSAVLEVRFG
jgi:hypothetical protein